MTDKLTPGQKLFAELEIDINEVDDDLLQDYVAAQYYLTVEDEKPADAPNLEKVGFYLEAFYHLCQAEDWENAKNILFTEIGFEYNNRLSSQITIWGYYREIILLEEKLLGKLGLKFDAIFLHSIGLSLNGLEKYQKGIQCHNLMLQICRKLESNVGEGVALGTLAMDHLLNRNFSQATLLYEESLNILKKYNHPIFEQTFLVLLGEFYSFPLFPLFIPESIKCYERVLEISKEIKNKPLEGGSLALLSIAYINLGHTTMFWNFGNNKYSQENYTKAINYSLQSLEILRETSSGSLQEASALSFVALAYRAKEEYDEAISYYQEALELAKKSKNKRIEGGTLGLLGVAYVGVENYSSSIDCLKKSLEISREIEDKILECSSLMSLTVSYIRSYQFSEASEVAWEFLTTFPEMYKGTTSLFSDVYLNDLKSQVFAVFNTPIQVEDL